MRPPRSRAQMKPPKSRPAASCCPTHMLAEKNVKPSMTMNMLRLDFLPVFDTGPTV